MSSLFDRAFTNFLAFCADSLKIQDILILKNNMQVYSLDHSRKNWLCATDFRRN